MPAVENLSLLRRQWRPAADRVGVPLTPRQEEVFRTLIMLHRKLQRPPTMRELLPVLGIGSTNGIVAHLDALARRGLIEPLRRGLKRGGGGRWGAWLHIKGLVWTPCFEDNEAGQRLREVLGGEMPE